jgi:hypothetical protein
MVAGYPHRTLRGMTHVKKPELVGMERHIVRVGDRTEAWRYTLPAK